MKETIYGWYPALHNIYRPKGEPSSHHLESLYNFKDYQAQKVVHQPELFVKGVSNVVQPGTPKDLKKRAKSAPVPKSYHESKIYIPTLTQCWAKNGNVPETSLGQTNNFKPYNSKASSEVSWPLLQDSTEQMQGYLLPQKHQQQQLLKADIQPQYNTHIAQNAQDFQSFFREHTPPCTETSSVLTWPNAQNASQLRPQTSLSRQSVKSSEKMARKERPTSTPLWSSKQDQTDTKFNHIPTPPKREDTSLSKCHGRIHSATIRRDKTSQPSRPVTAAVIRQSAVDLQMDPAAQPSEVEKAPKSAGLSPIVANDKDPFEDLIQPPRPTKDDYETIVNKYGWRAQIHGDPYQLKKPMKRLSYTVQCTAPATQYSKTSVHMKTKEPFFYNTIPSKPLSFSVHKEWMSEAVLAKRLELQKQDGRIKYNYKNFAFVY